MISLEQAIQTALEYENRVRKVYVDALARANDATAKSVLEVMVAEEQRHLDYLESRLAEWKRTGKVSPAVLATDVPSAQRIVEGVKTLEARMQLPESEGHGTLVQAELDSVQGNGYWFQVPEFALEGA